MGRKLERSWSAPDGQWLENHNSKLREWNSALAKVVRYGMGKMTVTEFAQRIHYTRSTVSTLLNQDAAATQRPWTLDTLVSIADVFGCSVADIFCAAQRQIESPEAVKGLSLRILGTKPHSRERLQQLVYEVVGFREQEDDPLLGVANRIQYIELANKEFCEAYYSGALSDTDALAELQKAEEVTARPNEEPWPLWAALQQTFRR